MENESDQTGIRIMENSSWIQCEAPKIAKLVQITPITMVYGTYNYSYWGESKPTYNWGASHCRHGVKTSTSMRCSSHVDSRSNMMFGSLTQRGVLPYTF